MDCLKLLNNDLDPIHIKNEEFFMLPFSDCERISQKVLFDVYQSESKTLANMGNEYSDTSYSMEIKKKQIICNFLFDVLQKVVLEKHVMNHLRRYSRFYLENFYHNMLELCSTKSDAGCIVFSFLMFSISEYNINLYIHTC